MTMPAIARWGAFWITILASVGFAGYVVTSPPTPPHYTAAEVRAAEAVATPSRDADQSVVLFIGDSYTAGGGTVGPTGTFAALTCSAMKWYCVQDAEGGTGYIANGKVNYDYFEPFIGRLPDTISKYRADVIIVSGGRNDNGAPGEAEATRKYFKALRAGYPDAKIIVLSPFWNTAQLPPTMLVVREAIHAAASSVDARWIDTTGWLTEDLMGPDDVHPLPAGHQAITAKLVPKLRKMKLA